jgi:hypothetical protein
MLTTLLVLAPYYHLLTLELKFELRFVIVWMNGCFNLSH